MKEVKNDTTTHIYMTAHFSWLGIGTSIKSGRVKLVLWTKSFPVDEIMWSGSVLSHVSKMPTGDLHHS